MLTDRPTVGNRLVSMILDHFIMCIVIMLPLMPLFYIGSRAETVEGPNTGFQFLFLGLMLLYFAKDSFQGRSLAKRMTKLQVVDYRTGEVASPIRCFVRNLPIIIWPVEVIVTLFNPQRRLGDLMAGTKVINFGVPAVNNKFEFESPQTTEL